MAPISIDGTDITGATIDGTSVTQITVDSQRVFGELSVPDESSLQAHYDFSQEDGTLPVVDRSNNSNDLGNGGFTGVGGSINGKQAGVFDGGNDFVKGSQFTSVSQPFTFAWVARIDDNTDSTVLSVSENDFSLYGFNNGNWNLNGQGSGIAGTNNTSIKLIVGVINRSESFLRENGSQTASGNTGYELLELITLGREEKIDEKFWTGNIGEVLIYPDERTSSQITDIEDYLSSSWSITL